MDQKKRKEDSNSEDDDFVGERKENKKKQLKKAIHPQKSANEDHAVDADLHLGPYQSQCIRSVFENIEDLEGHLEIYNF